MSRIRVAIDQADFMKGDVVIVKRTFVQGRELASTPKLLTRCSSCKEFFPTQYRRMGRAGTRRACEVRNVPQCSKCRGRYAREAREAKRNAIDVDVQAIANAENEGMPPPKYADESGDAAPGKWQ